MKRTSGFRPVFELAEWETLLIDDQVLTASDQRLKEELGSGEEGRLLVDELRAGVRITARSWVGVVRFERFEVRVIPKLAGDSIALVEMIEFATGLDALRRSSSVRSLHAEGAGLLDLIALLLAEGAELILRGGLLADYVEREDELPVVRGRLLGDATDEHGVYTGSTTTYAETDDPYESRARYPFKVFDPHEYVEREPGRDSEWVIGYREAERFDHCLVLGTTDIAEAIARFREEHGTASIWVAEQAELDPGDDHPMGYLDRYDEVLVVGGAKLRKGPGRSSQPRPS